MARSRPLLHLVTGHRVCTCHHCRFGDTSLNDFTDQPPCFIKSCADMPCRIPTSRNGSAAGWALRASYQTIVTNNRRIAGQHMNTVIYSGILSHPLQPSKMVHSTSVSGGDSTCTVTIPEARLFRFKTYDRQLLESSQTSTPEGPLEESYYRREGSQHILSSTAPSSVAQGTVDQDGSLKLLAVGVLDSPFTLKIAGSPVPPEV